MRLGGGIVREGACSAKRKKGGEESFKDDPIGQKGEGCLGGGGRTEKVTHAC